MSLTKTKVSEAIALRKFLLSNENDLDIITNIRQLKISNKAFEAAAHKKYYVTKSDFEKCLNDLEQILARQSLELTTQIIPYKS